MLIVCIGLLTAGLIPACKKEDSSTHELTTREKLLGNWRRNQRARDTNGNHLIDSSEIDYSPSSRATDTIILSLVPDATYMRIQVFKGTKYPESGTWHLQDDDSELVLHPSTSTSHVDTFRLDVIHQDYFLQHRVDSTGLSFYESFIRPN